MGLVRRYSNHKDAARRLSAAIAEAESAPGRLEEPARSAPRPRARILSPDELTHLAADYQAGMTVYELAAKYRISRETVSKHLHRMGVEIRRQGLNEQQAIEAVRLYGEGLSAFRIGERIGAQHNTVRQELIRRGVRMRDSHGRET